MSATVDAQRRDCAISVLGGPTTVVDITGRRIGRAGNPLEVLVVKCLDYCPAVCPTEPPAVL